MRASRPVVLSAAAVLVLACAGNAVPRTPPKTPAGSARAGRAVPRAGSVPLAALFDNAGISDDRAASAADLDGTGRSLSAGDLAAAGWTPGRRITLHRTRLTWPDVPAGQPDNVLADGQQIPLAGKGGALTFLAASTNGDSAAVGEIVYTDGTRRPYELRVPDWTTGPPAAQAVGLPHTNTPEGQTAAPVRLYARTVPLDPARTLGAVVLPRSPGPPDLHVFALARRPPGTLTGSWTAGTSGHTPAGPWHDQTLRLVVHSSAGGRLARVRLDNTFAAESVTIARATVALQGTDAAPAGTPVPLTFGGAPAASLPAGGQVYSDPADLSVPAGTNLLVSLYIPASRQITAAPLHSAAVQTSYLTPTGSGDHSGDTAPDAFTGTVSTWPFLAGIDVDPSTGSGGTSGAPGTSGVSGVSGASGAADVSAAVAVSPGSVVVLGDSITDGVRSTPGANNRWPDLLAARLRAQSRVPRYGVLNQGISANRVTLDHYPGDGTSTRTGGVSALNRLDRDVLAQTAPRTLIVFEGINDLREGVPAAEVVAGLREIAARSRAHGLRVLVATLAPCAGYHDCSPEVDARRERANALIRENRDGDGGRPFDGVLDFDAVLRDPADRSRLLPALDSGDHLHPGDAGLAAVADSIDLTLLVPEPEGAKAAPKDTPASAPKGAPAGASKDTPANALTSRPRNVPASRPSRRREHRWAGGWRGRRTERWTGRGTRSARRPGRSGEPPRADC